MKRRFLFFYLLLAGCVQSQTPPFIDEIQAFKASDAKSTPPEGAILLVGSSSFTKWTDVQAYFPGYSIINRGFGGSTLTDVIRYANEIIIPYKPAQVVVYCGDNDLASSDTVTAQVVYKQFIHLFTIVRNGLPNATISFVSIKPSPSRQHLMPEMQRANALIKTFLAGQKHTSYIDVFAPMLNNAGQPIPAIFISDSLHMNAQGYAIWQKAMKPYLLKK